MAPPRASRWAPGADRVMNQPPADENAHRSHPRPALKPTSISEGSGPRFKERSTGTSGPAPSQPPREGDGRVSRQRVLLDPRSGRERWFKLRGATYCVLVLSIDPPRPADECGRRGGTFNKLSFNLAEQIRESEYWPSRPPAHVAWHWPQRRLFACVGAQGRGHHPPRLCIGVDLALAVDFPRRLVSQVSATRRSIKMSWSKAALRSHSSARP